MQQEGRLEFEWFVFFFCCCFVFYLFISSEQNVLNLWYLPQKTRSKNNSRVTQDAKFR